MRPAQGRSRDRWPGGGQGSHGGGGGGSKRGCLEAAKGRDNQSLSLTPPQPWRPARTLLSPPLSLSLASPFCCLTSSYPAPEAPSHPTKEDPFWPTGARAVGTWEDGPSGAPAGHEGEAGAPGAAKLVLFSHPARLLLSLSTSLRVSPHPSVSRSTSLSLSLHVSVFQRLEHSHQLYEVRFSICLEVHPLHTREVIKSIFWRPERDWWQEAELE